MTELFSSELYRLPWGGIYVPPRVCDVLRRPLAPIASEWRLRDPETAAVLRALDSEGLAYPIRLAAAEVGQQTAPRSDTGAQSVAMGELTSAEVAKRLHLDIRSVTRQAASLGGRFDPRTRRWWFPANTITDYEETHGS
jgi:hypothetical protein